MKLLAGLLFLGASLAAQRLEFGREGDCGLSALKPSRVSHFVETAAVSKATPKYPAALKLQGIGGKVHVRLLVNIAGHVELTCPEYIRGSVKPHRSLVIAAEAAALEWRYKANFGIVSTGGSSTAKLRYVEGTVAFEFIP